MNSRIFGKIVRMPRGNPVPNAVMTSMTYIHSAALASTLGVIEWSKYTFRMNSILDPDYSGGGHQPIGRDQWATLYNRYYVYAVSFDVWINNTNPNNTTGGVWALQFHETTAVAADPNNTTYGYLEELTQPSLHAVWKHNRSPGSGGNTTWLNLRKTFRTMANGGLGVAPIDDFCGSALNNPAASRYVSLTGQFPQATATVSNWAEVRMKMHCILFDPVELIGS